MASKQHQTENKNRVLTNYDVYYNQQLQPENKKKLTEKEFLNKLVHPDYILFDWEYFSRELEFE